MDGVGLLDAIEGILSVCDGALRWRLALWMSLRVAVVLCSRWRRFVLIAVQVDNCFDWRVEVNSLQRVDLKQRSFKISFVAAKLRCY